MTAKSVVLRPQGLRPRARASTCPPPLLRHCSEFRRKHLFITACIEKQCTRHLSFSYVLCIGYFTSLFYVVIYFTAHAITGKPNSYYDQAEGMEDGKKDDLI